MRNLLASRPFLLPALILLIGIAGTLFVSYQVKRASDSRDHERFARLISERQDALVDRMQNYVALLRGAAGHVKATPALTRASFSEFVDRLRLAEYYPGVQGIGFAAYFREDERPAILERLRRDYSPEMVLRPEGTRDEYSAILYLEPLDRRNAAALGFDMYSEPVRRQAMVSARDEANAFASGKVKLVQEIDSDVQPGFLVYVPIYEGLGVPRTLVERRARFRGWAYSPFRARDFFSQILGRSEKRDEIEVAIYDGEETTPENLLYATPGYDSTSETLREETQINIAGRVWTASFAATPAFYTDSNRYLAPVVLIIGLIISLLLFGVATLQERSITESRRSRAKLQEVNDQLALQMAEVQERTHDLREANDELQRFAYIVSHDLRSPLVNIMGFTAELEALKQDIFERLRVLQGGSTIAESDERLSADFGEALSFIKSSIGKMDRLINSILQLSRAGRREFKAEYVSMDALIKAIVESVSHQAAESDVEFIVEPLPPIKSDRMALEQIFSNLVDNAVKYTKPGQHGVVRIRGSSTPTQVTYEVHDNGRGIAPHDHQRVFDLFRRAGEQDKPGEGIGLAHVRALVRRLGGYMTLKSELGEGSTFSVTLPRTLREQEKQRA